MTTSLFVLLLVTALLPCTVLLRRGREGTGPSSQAREESTDQRVGHIPAEVPPVVAVDVDERIVELEREFGFMPDRRWRDWGSNG